MFNNLVWDGQNLKKIRGDLTQRKIATDLNISHFTVSSWETNKQRPSDENVVALAEYFQVDTTDFFEQNKSSRLTVPLGTIDPEQSINSDSATLIEDPAPSLLYFEYVDNFRDGALLLSDGDGNFFKAVQL